MKPQIECRNSRASVTPNDEDFPGVDLPIFSSRMSPLRWMVRTGMRWLARFPAPLPQLQAKRSTRRCVCVSAFVRRCLVFLPQFAIPHSVLGSISTVKRKSKEARNAGASDGEATLALVVGIPYAVWVRLSRKMGRALGSFSSAPPPHSLALTFMKNEKN